MKNEHVPVFTAPLRQVEPYTMVYSFILVWLCPFRLCNPTSPLSELQNDVGSSWESVLSLSKSVYSCVEMWPLQLEAKMEIKVPPHPSF